MSFITKILESIFPFLFSALKRAWDNLTTPQQQAIINAGTIGQYIKNNLNALGDDLIDEIAKATSLPTATVESTLIALAGKLGATTEIANADTAAVNAVTYIQAKLKSAASDEEWNGLLQIILNAGGTLLSGGSLNWLHLALGVAEWAYQQFIQPLNIPILNTVVGAVENGAASTAQASTHSTATA